MDSLNKLFFFDKLDHIKKFYLKTDSMYFDQDRVKEWINSIALRKVQELFFSIKCSIVVPLQLFYCESLTVLDFRFDNQQKLRLSFIHFKDKTLAMQLFSNCPVLEDLYMSNVSWKGLDVICFAMPQLKFFEIGGSVREGIENVKVKFDTPNLLTLTWFDYLPEEFIVVDSFPCLVEAGIRYNFARGYTKSRYDSLFNFVEKASHVKHLMVSHTYFCRKILEGPNDLPKSYHNFHNLVSFEVDVIYYNQIGLLYDIVLQRSPNLTSLIFHQLVLSPVEVDNPFPVNIVPRCLLLCLESIEFRKFHGHRQEIEVVKLFLEGALVLQKITLGSSSHRLEYMIKRKPTTEEVEDANGKILEKLKGVFMGFI
ncbi:hypothetical protein MKX03_015865 [Papaver bracteatum]|nr:hypothetical protein MKX03_015865 [Papaver bracteatum]